MRILPFMKKYISAIFILLILNNTVFAKEYEFKPLNLYSVKDRILILSPHPDDEVIGTAGIIQKAQRCNIPLKIVYLTNGDNNEPSFIVDQKRLVLLPKAVLTMGKKRIYEAINGMNSLGVKRDQLVFLGYPDWGTEKIFTSFWFDKKPFKSMLTRVRHVPYEEALSPGAPYLGESILKDLIKIIQDFKPTKIFVSHPIDTHRDHRAFFLFLQIALWDLEVEPEIYGYLVHWNRWPYRKQLFITPPKDWPIKDTTWFSWNLDEVDIKKKRQAISFYKTQIGYNPPFLFSFVRQNELFSDIKISDLSQYSEFNIEDSVVYKKDASFVYIKLKSDILEIETKQLQIFLIGYKKQVPFNQMPKIRIDIGSTKNLSVYDKGININVPDAKIEIDNKTKEVFIRFPIGSLNYPDNILTFFDHRKSYLKTERSWWVIKMLDSPTILSQYDSKIINN